MHFTYLTVAVAASFTIATAAPIDRADNSKAGVMFPYEVHFKAGTPESIVRRVAQAGVQEGAYISWYWGLADDRKDKGFIANLDDAAMKSMAEAGRPDVNVTFTMYNGDYMWYDVCRYTGPWIPCGGLS